MSDDDYDFLADQAAELQAWDDYWESLTPDERKRELAMMDAHAAQSDAV